eukprot:707878_1
MPSVTPQQYLELYRYVANHFNQTKGEQRKILSVFDVHANNVYEGWPFGRAASKWKHHLFRFHSTNDKFVTLANALQLTANADYSIYQAELNSRFSELIRIASLRLPYRYLQTHHTKFLDIDTILHARRKAANKPDPECKDDDAVIQPPLKKRKFPYHDGAVVSTQEGSQSNHNESIASIESLPTQEVSQPNHNEDMVDAAHVEVFS